MRLKLQNELRQLISAFFIDVKKEHWFGKEREMISRFAFTHLIKSKLLSPEQIGIEVRVKQVNTGGKKEVCKDLIIWKYPNQTVWSKENTPLCIMEWKHGNKKPSISDINWLRRFSKKHPACFGIAINIENKPYYAIQATMIENGQITDPEYLNQQ